MCYITQKYLSIDIFLDNTYSLKSTIREQINRKLSLVCPGIHKFSVTTSDASCLVVNALQKALCVKVNKC